MYGYREVFNRIIDNDYQSLSDSMNGSDDDAATAYSNDIEVIEELIGRAEPMKPLNKVTSRFGVSIGKCPICNKDVVEGYGCGKCLQAIDWENN